MGETRVLHCACGAKREAPANLTIVSCVQCGRAMSPTSPTQIVGPPRRTHVAAATLASQLVGTLAFALAVYWIAWSRTTNATTILLAVSGAVSVFAGGQGHRGSTNALLVCITFNTAVAVLLLARIPAALRLANPALTDLSLSSDVLALAGIFAALAAVACLTAIPQARRFADWRTSQILHAARTSRGV